MFHKVVQVVLAEDDKVYVYFKMEKLYVIDAKSLLDKKVFEPLRNLDIFVNTCTVLNDHTCMGHFRE